MSSKQQHATASGLALVYRGLETGHPRVDFTHVKQDNIELAIQSLLEPDEEIGKQLKFYEDVALELDPAAAVYILAVARVVFVWELWCEEDEFGVVAMAILKNFADIACTFL
ncbi:hypothetical protein DSO57_1027434 [Entomophthora muscae]|uniref:Uncharacterized protein n=1 Tax=Entomophthora muscae TaxID=34485 RepID=A0ACC2UM64_9FUNG|nr:hypothetical protein DSO57_1027434 [Entomophthora muscae]